MTPLFKKLNFKDHSYILVLNHPSSFEPELQEMVKEASIIKELALAKDVEFALTFATTQAQVDDFATAIHSKLKGDAILWICYPKGSSKKYKCDFNRDSGWAKLGEFNLEPVRQVAIDEDWSALRFRKVEYIKNITRRESFALTQGAKNRTNQKGV